MQVKRSEFYTLMGILFIFILVSTANAVQYQVSVIQPTKPYKYNKEITSANGYNAYNTMVDVSGKGIMNRCKLQFADGITNNKLFIKLTIDGVAYEFSGLNVAYTDTISSNTAADGMQFTNIHGGAAAYTANSLSINGPIYFKTSLKVEVKQTNSGSGSQSFMHTSVDYATE